VPLIVVNFEIENIFYDFILHILHYVIYVCNLFLLAAASLHWTCVLPVCHAWPATQVCATEQC